MYLWLYWVFAVAHGLSLVAASRGCSLVAGDGLLTVVGSSCGAQAPGMRASVMAACLLRSVAGAWV